VRRSAVPAGEGEVFMERDCEMSVTREYVPKLKTSTKRTPPGSGEVLVSCLSPDIDRVM
jgi:hypothetical protein